jgi:hypothetical protein
MAKKREVKPERLNITLTLEQTQKLNTYIINVGKKQGRIPSAIKTKILRVALDEWFQKYENDFNIDWDKQK